MKLRYIGGDPDGVDVVCSGTRIAAGVKPGEVIDVADEVHGKHSWSEEIWEVVTAAPATAKVKKGDD